MIGTKKPLADWWIGRGSNSQKISHSQEYSQFSQLRQRITDICFRLMSIEMLPAALAVFLSGGLHHD